jgi:nitric oxide reductase large subunit
MKMPGAGHVWGYDPLLNIVPFNVARAIHINLPVLWLLLGLMGATYYMAADEIKTEICSLKLARVPLARLLVSSLTAIATPKVPTISFLTQSATPSWSRACGL